MGVEQTTQLIQLILNSVLISVVCALTLAGVMARHGAVGSQLQALTRHQAELWDQGWDEQALGVRKALRSLQQRYQVSRYSLLAMHYAFTLALLSTFMLALRTIVIGDWLIPLAMGCFVLGVAVLLLGFGLLLIDLHLSDRPLLEESRTLLGAVDGTSRLPRSTAHRLPQGTMAKLPPSRLKRRVG